MLVVVCWTVTTLAEFATGRRAEPVMIGDAVFGVGLLWFAWRYNRGFLWVMVGIQATLFFLHALLYEASTPPSRIQALGNNLLATGALIVLVVAALRSWRLRAKSRRAIAAGAEL